MESEKELEIEDILKKLLEVTEQSPLPLELSGFENKNSLNSNTPPRKGEKKANDPGSDPELMESEKPLGKALSEEEKFH